MRVALLAFGLLLSVAIGAVGAYILIRHHNRTWIELSEEHHGLAFSNEVFTDSDIPLPDIKEPHGQAKFVDRGIGKGTELSFLVQVSIEKLDTTKLPEKYKKPQQWGTLTLDPTESVTYNAHLDFMLKDLK